LTNSTKQVIINISNEREVNKMISIKIPSNTSETELFNAYCLGKSNLWNMFFGWRKTAADDDYIFTLPEKDYTALVAQSDEIKNMLTIKNEKVIINISKGKAVKSMRRIVYVVDGIETTSYEEARGLQPEGELETRFDEIRETAKFNPVKAEKRKAYFRELKRQAEAVAQ
jgi:hypothetical protein